MNEFWRETVTDLALVGHGLASSWSRGESGFGVAGLGDAAPDTLTFTSAVATFGILSICIGLLNLMPLFPMDNGRTVNWLIQHWWGGKAARGFQLGGTALVACSLVAAVISDVWVFATAIL